VDLPTVENLRRGAELIRDADALLVTAGAGMGVDSGLPDFRGDQGFWRTYPALKSAGIRFTDIANPAAFRANPRRAWGFYGHRLNLYRRAVPHSGFQILMRWMATRPKGGFVFTSNVDAQFQRAGLPADRIAECHGSIHWLQCLRPCHDQTWPVDAGSLEIDETRCLIRSPIPRCPACGGVARPNILMFGDWDWIAGRSELQQRRLAAWLTGASRLVVIEIGAGTAVPTVRRFGESLACPLIRINPDAGSDRDAGAIRLPLEALAALRQLDRMVTEQS
jgi:NAD-dependent SIR2 family protein deacetylase